MTSATDLERLKHAARYGRVIPSSHARQRMRQRSVTPKDIEKAIFTATAAELQEPAVFRLSGGVDLDGDPLVVVVREIQPGLLVVTVI